MIMEVVNVWLSGRYILGGLAPWCYHHGILSPAYSFLGNLIPPRNSLFSDPMKRHDDEMGEVKGLQVVDLSQCDIPINTSLIKKTNSY